MFFYVPSYNVIFTPLTCPDTSELDLPSPHSVAMRFSPGRRSAASGLRKKRENDMMRGHDYLKQFNV